MKDLVYFALPPREVRHGLRAFGEEEPTEELVDEPVESEEATVTEESTVEPVSEATSENCLTCHSDKEQLIDTAAPEPEETESSESSGVG